MNEASVLLTLPRECHADAGAAMSHEWLLTNAIGGFASGTVALANTRRYHGLLVAARQPSLERLVTVAKVDAVATVGVTRFALGCNEYADGTVDPHGYRELVRFELVDGLPVWHWLIGGAHLELRIWMARERNTTFLRWTFGGGADELQLELTPLCTYRDYHQHRGGGWQPQVKSSAHGCRIVAGDGALPYVLKVDPGRFCEAPDWYWGFRHRVEAERGLDATEDLFRPGRFEVSLRPGEAVTMTITAEDPDGDQPGESALEHRARVSTLVRELPTEAPWWIRQLVLAADQFLVRRAPASGPDRGVTVIAGYPWFTDWGRDTMIALPGLTLATGRLDDAASILRTFAGYVSDGLLPNRFPDAGGTVEYNTVDATLWYFHALRAYLDVRQDQRLLGELYPTLRDIILRHERGTRYGIMVDPADGLLRAGEPGVQLTWMDAKVGDWVVTPRIGKAVEVNALWHYALRQMARWAAQCGDERAAGEYETAERRVRQSFVDAFWSPALGRLYDVVDGPEGEEDAAVRRADASLRPNQLFAVSLGEGLLDAHMERSVVASCASALATPVGLRSLASDDPRFQANYGGGPRDRDAAYHQGTVWSWLTGPFAIAHHRVYRDTEYGLRLLEGVSGHLLVAGIGNISEIFDATAPYAPRGCIAQAWSVAEILRAWSVLRRHSMENTAWRGVDE